MFIVLEGIDGAGKGRQRVELLKALEKEACTLQTTDFPDHHGVLYREILHPMLHEELTIPPKAVFLTFALDQLLWRDRILPAQKKSATHFIADGYFTTTLVYQCIVEERFSIEEALSFAEKFEIPIPDAVVYIDVDPRIAMERKKEEEGHDEGHDIYERSIEKQQRIREGFRTLANDQIFGRWYTIDGSQAIEEVAQNIHQTLRDNNIL